MRISFRRSGGVTGIGRAFDVSTDALPPDTAAELRRLVEESGVLGMSAVPAGDPSMADTFTYTITVESGGVRTTLSTTDAAAPDPLRPLLAWLNRAARSQPHRFEEE